MTRLMICALLGYLTAGCGANLRATRTSLASTGGSCEAGDIQAISREYQKGNEQLSFELSFAFQAPTVEGSPVVIVLPGGPGGTSIDRRAKLPNGFGAVHTDPRGVGCNEGLYPDSFYSSANLASDIIAIIGHLNLKKYILYGSSYGTALATLTAAELAKTEFPQPEAVVLHGTLGRAWKSSDELYSGFIEEWETVKEGLPAAAVARLEKEDAAAEIPAEAWSDAIQGELRYGSVRQQKSSLSSVLPLLADNTPQSDKLVRSVFYPEEAAEDPKSPAPVDAAEQHTETPSDRMYRVIACAELLPTPLAGLIYRRGKLVTETSGDIASYCKGIRENRYDAKSYKLRVPIFYIQGAKGLCKNNFSFLDQ